MVRLRQGFGGMNDLEIRGGPCDEVEGAEAPSGVGGTGRLGGRWDSVELESECYVGVNEGAYQLEVVEPGDSPDRPERALLVARDGWRFELRPVGELIGVFVASERADAGRTSTSGARSKPSCLSSPSTTTSLSRCSSISSTTPGTLSARESGELVVRALHRGLSIVVEIEDTGCGMSSEQLEKVFMPFFTTTEVGKGTGLGLSISHGLVEAMGGHIEVRSEVGQGTTFSIILPAG